MQLWRVVLAESRGYSAGALARGLRKPEAGPVDRRVARPVPGRGHGLSDAGRSIPGLELAVWNDPFAKVSGDLFDVVPLGSSGAAPEKWAIFIGDASGRGESAARVMARVRTLLRGVAGDTRTPADLMRHLNDSLCRLAFESSFVTAFVGVYEPATRRLTYSNAGHPPPLVRAPHGGSTRRLDSAGGYPLGIDAGRVFEEASVYLEYGHSVLLYTDGISEARDRSGAMFGVEGIERAFGNSGRLPRDIVASVRESVRSHRHGRAATDDQTLAALSVG